MPVKELLHLPRDFIRQVRRAARRRFFPRLEIRDNELKVPLAVLLEAVQRAQSGDRLKLFRRLLPYLSATATASSSAACEINSLRDFKAGYARLATLLGQSGKVPPPGEIEFLREVGNRRVHYSGTIAPSDYFFLSALVSLLAPQRVVEIGTLTGFSAAIIAGALRHQREQDGPRWVDSIDVRETCLIDETRPTGFEIAECFPELAAMVRLHIPHDSTVVSELAEPDELELVFIDANHQHPMPLLDLLKIAPCIRDGGWVVLHDIQLGTMGRRASAGDPTLRWGVAEGAELLFNSWPFQKISGGNIGAIQLPNDKGALIPFALRLMSLPYEVKGNRAYTIKYDLHRSFAALV
jgi:predicted O-methyltransferase YrrM